MKTASPDQLAAALARAMPPLVWVHGDEPLISLESADAVRAAARKHGAVERHVFETGRAFRPQHLLAEASALSLFGDGKLLELRCATKPGKEILSLVAELEPSLGEQVRLLVISPRLDRTTLNGAAFAQLGVRALMVAVQEVPRADLPAWIGRRLARQQQRTDAATLEFIAERVEGNLLAAEQEVRKLGLLFPAGELASDDVRGAVLNVARYGAFDLVDPMLAGDAARVFRTLAGLRAEGEAGPLVLWSVADALRTLLRLHEARAAGRPLQTELRAARVFGPRERLYGNALARLDRSTVSQGLQRAALVDRMMKGLAAGDAWALLESLTLRMAGAVMPQHPNPIPR